MEINMEEDNTMVNTNYMEENNTMVNNNYMEKDITKINNKNDQSPLYSFTLKNHIIEGSQEPYEKINVAEEILETLKYFPTFIGLVNTETHKEVTYHKMRQKSIKCAMWLKSVNVMPGTLITICAWKTIDLYVPLLAGLYIGAIVNIWDRNCKLNLNVLRRTKPRVIFADRKHILQMYALYAFFLGENDCPLIVDFQSSSTDFISFDMILHSFTNDEIEKFVCWPIKNQNDPAVILYTLDMMNVERNIEISHLAICAALKTEIIHMLYDTNGLWHGNLGSYLNLILFFDAIFSQVTLFVWWKDDYRKLCMLIDEYMILWTYFNIEQTKQLCDFLVGLEQALLFRKCLIASSDDSTDNEVWNKSAIESHNLQIKDKDVADTEEGKQNKSKKEKSYQRKREKSMTPDVLQILEFENIDLYNLECIVHDVDLKRPWIHDVLTSKLHKTRIIMLHMYPEIGIISYRWGVGEHGNVGYVNRNIQLMIVNSKGISLGPNEEGEICCRSPCQMKSYYQQPLMTESVINQGWLRTGDLGCYDFNYCIYTYGSVNRIIKYQDEIVSIAEIESFLMKYKLVKEACILPIMDANVGQRSFAFLVKRYPVLAKHVGILARKREIKQVIQNGLKYSHNLSGGILFVRQLPYTYFNTVDIKRLHRILIKVLQHEGLCYI